MNKNTNLKVCYIAFSQPHEVIVPMNYTLLDISKYLGLVCKTYLITDIAPTTRDITI